MADTSPFQNSAVPFNENALKNDGSRDASADVRVQKTEALREKISGLGSIRISSPVTERDPADVFVAEQVDPLSDMAARRSVPENEAGAVSIAGSLFFIASVIWVAYGVGFFIQSGIEFSPQGLAIALMTLLGPPSLAWYVIAQFRKGDAFSPSFSSAAPVDYIAQVQDFYNQAEDVTVHARGLLKSLQRSRQGLRGELQAFEALSKALDGQVARLSTSLSDKANDVLGMSDTIDSHVGSIEKRTEESISAWSNALQEACEQADALGVGLDAKTERIVSCASELESKTASIQANVQTDFAGLEDTIDHLTDRIDTIGVRFDGYSDSLTVLIDGVSDKADALSETVSSQIRTLEEVTHASLDSVTDTADTVLSRQAEMQSSVETLQGQAGRIAKTIEASITDLKAGADYATSQAEGLEVRLAQQAETLRDSVSDIEKQADLIEEVGDQAVHKLGESLSVAVGGADSISFAVRRAVDILEEGGRKAQTRADDIIANSSQRSGALQAELSSSILHLESAARVFETSYEKTEGVLDRAGQRVSDLSSALDTHTSQLGETVSSLSGAVSCVGDTLNESVRTVTNAVSEVDVRQSMIEDVMTRRVGDLNDASTRALSTVDSIRDNLREHIQDMSALSSQLSVESRTAHDTITAHKGQLESVVKGSMDQVELFSGALEMQVRKVEAASHTAEEHMGACASVLETRYQDLQALKDGAEAGLEGWSASVSETCQALYSEHDKVRESFSTLNAGITESADLVSPTCELAIKKADEVHARFSRLRADCADISDSNIFRFKQFGVVLEENLTDLKEGASCAADVFDAVNESLDKRAKALKDTAYDAANHVKDATHSLKAQTETIHLLGDQAVLKMDTVQKEIQGQFMDFSESVSQAVMKLETAGDVFTRESDLVQNEVQAHIGTLKSVGVKVREEVVLISDTAEKVAQDADAVMGDVQGRGRALLQASEELLGDFKKTGDTLLIRSRELGEQMKASLKTSEMYGRELKSQVTSLSGSGIDVADQISQAVSMLGSSMDTIGRAAHDTTGQISTAREALSIEAERLMQVSSAALDTTKDASDKFTSTSEDMFKAVTQVQESVVNLKQHDMKAERSAFLSASRFIVESLHSLSVDVARTLQGGDVSDASWSAFEKGDVSVFTRKLSALGDTWPLERAQKKMKDDTEFRTYVQRFMRQFEDLYAQASQNDHGALLSVTLGSSDIAKLYTHLCDVTGRVNLVAKKDP